jgi:hypothetical protein
MKYLEKIWIRILVSLFLGSIASEVIYITTGDPDSPRTNTSGIVLATGLVFFILITLCVKIYRKHK